MKKTNNQNKSKMNAILLILASLTIIFGVVCYYIINNFNEEDGILLKVCILIVPGFLFLFSLSGLIAEFMGIFKAKKIAQDETKNIKKNNKYIYYRELPNNFGIGVATLLMDSTIENEKDIVAVILDLCAKGYLKLEKENNNYKVTVLKFTEEKLLFNEKYIINCILNGNIKNFDYKEWFEFCIQDGINLKLFNKRVQEKVSPETNLNNKDEKLHKIKKIYKRVCIAIAIFFCVIIFFINKSKYTLVFSIIKTLFEFCIWYAIAAAVLFLPMIIIPSMIISIMKVSKETSKHSFNWENSKNLELTEFGRTELQKLYSFKAFIKDFGEFTSKNPEEVELWEYYLSYAQIFGLADTILASGYDKIIKNGSFEIDNLSSIKLSELDIVS